jgi:hypothetical protein
LKVTPPPSATRRAAAWASSFGLPTTKLSNVKRPSSGEVGRSLSPAAAAAGGSAARGAAGDGGQSLDTPNSSRLTLKPSLASIRRIMSP